MKRQLNKARVAFLASYSVLLLTSCVNQIESEEIPTGTIPITFSTKLSNSSTRATDTAFEKGDKIGLYAMLSSVPISETRYIDNLRLECGESNTLIPEKTVFYPVGETTLDFFSYYPYQEEGIPAAKANIPIAIQKDQSTPKGHTQSDFLVATISSVASSEQTVELNFKHKLSKLKIVLTPKEGENAASMLNDNLRIVATSFQTKANYKTLTNTFADWEEEGDLLPYGEWTIKENTLIGKEFIVIPQTIDSQKQSFIIEWNGKIYTCPMPELTLTSGTQYEVNISMMQVADHLLTGVIGKIDDWTSAVGGDTENNESLTSVHLSALSFSQSEVYRIYSDGKPIMEICREYLHSTELTGKAITAYPVNEKEQSDLTQGVILQLMDEEEAIHGGSISWNVENNTFTYTPGSSKPMEKFYIDKEGKIVSEKPSNPMSINIISHTIRDIRNGLIKEYPIVKIGTQYWMKENLRSTTYRDGTSLAIQTELGNGAGYFKANGKEYYFYNGEAVLAGELAPEKWRIPQKKDWEMLQTYVTNQASMLKAGEWKKIGSNLVYPATDETGLNILSEGLFISYSTGTKHENLGMSAAYWISGDTKNTLAEKAVLFMSSSDEIAYGNNKPADKDYYQGLSIRCIKE